MYKGHDIVRGDGDKTQHATTIHTDAPSKSLRLTIKEVLKEKASTLNSDIGYCDSVYVYIKVVCGERGVLH